MSQSIHYQVGQTPSNRSVHQGLQQSRGLACASVTPLATYHSVCLERGKESTNPAPHMGQILGALGCEFSWVSLMAQAGPRAGKAEVTTKAGWSQDQKLPVLSPVFPQTQTPFLFLSAIPLPTPTLRMGSGSRLHIHLALNPPVPRSYRSAGDPPAVGHQPLAKTRNSHW